MDEKDRSAGARAHFPKGVGRKIDFQGGRHARVRIEEVRGLTSTANPLDMTQNLNSEFRMKNEELEGDGCGSSFLNSQFCILNSEFIASRGRRSPAPATEAAPAPP